MEAACRGARSAGGTTVGILPGLDRAYANPFVDVALPTGLGEGRNVLVVRAADAVIAVGGAYGTLSEIALALRGGTPVVGLHTWELVRRGQRDEGVIRAADASEAVELALGSRGRRLKARRAPGEASYSIHGEPSRPGRHPVSRRPASSTPPVILPGCTCRVTRAGRAPPPRCWRR